MRKIMFIHEQGNLLQFNVNKPKYIFPLKMSDYNKIGDRGCSHLIRAACPHLK